MHLFFFNWSVTSVNEDWTVPYDDSFRFYFNIDEGTAQIHFTVQKSTTQGIPLDLRFSMDSRYYDYSYRDFYANLTSGDRISINIAVNGDRIVFQVYNSSETSGGRLLDKQNVTSVNEEWTAPYSDRFDFYFEINEGDAQIHFTAQKVTEDGEPVDGGGGLDPLPIVVVVVVLLVVFISAFLIIRVRKQSKASVPPPPPPPPP
jgi:hypothetical protein